MKQLSHYQLLRVLGEGGMGIVYLAEDLRLKRKVAVKCIKPDKQDSESNNLQVRLQREATMLAQLNHPNIVQIYDTIDDQNQFALVMEYIDGCSLGKQLREQIAGIKQRLIWLQQIAEGLAAAHSKGLIHRDLKAENILVNKQGIAKITDFGIAKHTHSDHSDYTQTGKLLGSYGSLSPEQALGQELDARSDIFSLGIIAFKLLCGRHPFADSGNHNVLVQNLLHLPPLPAKRLNPELSDELIGLLDGMLAKQPQHRPQDAHVISQALRHSIDQLDADNGGPNFSETLDVDFANYGMVQRSITTKPLSSDSRFTLNTNDEVSRRGARRVVRYGLFTLLALIALAASYWGVMQSLKPEPLYVAILPPRINADSPMNAQQQQLVVSAVADALQQSVLNIDALHLISSQELPEYNGSYSDIARSVGANVIVESLLTCQKTRCDISLNRIQPIKNSNDVDAVPWLIQKKQNWQTQDVDDFLTINQAGQTRLSLLFPRYTHNSESSIALSESNYIQFLTWQHEAVIDAKNHKAILAAITAAQERYRSYMPFYDLYHFLCITLYDDSKDEYYLEQLSRQLTIAEELMPNQLSLLRAKVILLSRQGDRLATRAALNRFQQLNTQRTEILQLEAKVAEQEGDYKKAIANLIQVIDLRPTRANWYDLAINQVIVGATADAKKSMKQVFSLNPNDYEGLQLQGHIAIGEDKLDVAIQAYQRAVVINPQGHNYNNMGLAYLLQGDIELANVAFKKAVQITPDNALYLLNLADSFLLFQQTERAQQYYQKVLRLEAGKYNWSGLINTAQAYGHLQQDTDAIKAVHRSLRLAPDNSEVQFTAALVYSLTKQWPTALVSIEQSLIQGLSPVWYFLPWFDSLCTENSDRFNKVMVRYIERKRCLE